jgi:CheY-like chemotaxis protein
VIRVLICDDDATVRVVAKRMLESDLGCTVHECGDGLEVLPALAEGDFSFVILDLEMPGMNGIDTLEEIRSTDTHCHLPVMILTGEGGESTVTKLLRLGVSAYLLKPLDRASFVAKVGKLIQTLPKAS